MSMSHNYKTTHKLILSVFGRRLRNRNVHGIMGCFFWGGGAQYFRGAIEVFGIITSTWFGRNETHMWALSRCKSVPGANFRLT